MYLAENLIEKWGPVLNHESLPEIKDHYKKTLTAVLLENQEKAVREQRAAEMGFLSEAGTVTTNTDPGSSGAAGFSGGAADGGPVAGYPSVRLAAADRLVESTRRFIFCRIIGRYRDLFLSRLCRHRSAVGELGGRGLRCEAPDDCAAVVPIQGTGRAVLSATVY